MKPINFQPVVFFLGISSNELNSNPYLTANKSATNTYDESTTKKIQNLIKAAKNTFLILKHKNFSIENDKEFYKQRLSWFFNEYNNVPDEQARRNVKELFQNLFTEYSNQNTPSFTSTESPIATIKSNELSPLVRAQRAVESADYLAKCFKLDGNDKEKEIWLEKKISSLQKASDMGDAEATHLLGKLFYKKAKKSTIQNDDFKQNITKAVEYIAKSVIQSKKAEYLSYLKEIFDETIKPVEGDNDWSDEVTDTVNLITKTLKDLSQKADEVGEEVAGAAANYLGCCDNITYGDQCSVIYNDKCSLIYDGGSAFQRFLTAANLKNLQGMNNLAISYASGEGTQRDMKAAFSWFLRATTEGRLKSLNDLFYCYKQEPIDTSLRTFVKNELHILAEKTSKTRNDNVIEAINENMILQTLGDCCFWDEEYQEAFKKYQLGADNGSLYCIARLGECYEKGKGVEKDTQKAIYFYSKALTISGTIENAPKVQYSQLIKEKHPISLANNEFESEMRLKIDNCIQSILKKEKEIQLEKKISSLQKASDMGNAEATYLLGKLFYKKARKSTVQKDDFKQNITKAVEYITQSAIQSKKREYLSYLVKGIFDEAVKREVETHGETEETNYTKNLIIKTLSDLSQKSDEVGEELAGAVANYLGRCYKKTEDNENSFPYFLAAANLKNLQGRNELAISYAQGDGTQRDMKAAFSWLLRATTEGHLKSLVYLFTLYNQEPIDPSLRTYVKNELHMLAEKTNKTTNDNVTEAINENMILQTLGDCYFWDEEYQIAFRKYQQGAANGSPYCIARLGECYEKGKGVEKDAQKAIYFYSQALTICSTIENAIKVQYSDLTKFEGVMQLKINDCVQSLKPRNDS